MTTEHPDHTPAALAAIAARHPGDAQALSDAAGLLAEAMAILVRVERLLSDGLGDAMPRPITDQLLADIAKLKGE